MEEEEEEEDREVEDEDEDESCCLEEERKGSEVKCEVKKEVSLSRLGDDREEEGG